MTFSAEQRLKVKNHICEKNLGTSINFKTRKKLTYRVWRMIFYFCCDEVHVGWILSQNIALPSFTTGVSNTIYSTMLYIFVNFLPNWRILLRKRLTENLSWNDIDNCTALFTWLLCWKYWLFDITHDWDSDI